ncbi:MAG: transketolase family protein [Proteobacteria bacterium]|nr:transketolase family protein [Pseudomonadota bacterium]
MNTALPYKPDYNNLRGVREGIGDELVEQGKNYQNLFVLTGNLKESTKLDEFAEKYPQRFFDVGVAEQNLAGISAGLGLTNNIAFMSSYSVFSPGRNWDQVRVSICYSKANVKIIGGHAGLATGKDGATHQALEDLAITRVLPNLEILTPLDYSQAREAVKYAILTKNPVYIRSYREKSPQIFQNQNFNLLKPQIIKLGKDLTVISSGPVLFEALKTIEKIEKENKISIELINISCLKPLDSSPIIESLNKTKIGVSVEDHQIHGGLGSAILEKISERISVPFKIIGIEDTFGESGNSYELYEKYGISENKIKEKILQFLKRNK